MFARLTVALLLLAGALTAAPADAATKVTDPGGQLIGATGVQVGATLWDVAFNDTTCELAFDGCDSAADFQFPGADTADTGAAVAAAQAIVDQVFGDGDSFDLDPELTFGCDGTVGCLFDIPYFVAGSGSVAFQNGFNLAGSGGDNVGGAFFFNPDDSFADEVANATNRVMAVFSNPRSISAIPIPAPVVLLASALAGLGLMTRRRRARLG